jgi:2-oxo-4-hydroxy-4-carboxy--5-ureidoimidazoline (OHCU) decarboxylase
MKKERSQEHKRYASQTPPTMASIQELEDTVESLGEQLTAGLNQLHQDNVALLAALTAAPTAPLTVNEAPAKSGLLARWLGN